MKRFLPIMLVSLIFIIMLFGCNSENTESSPTVADDDLSQISDFTSSQSDKVEYSYYGGEPGTPLTADDDDSVHFYI